VRWRDTPLHAALPNAQRLHLEGYVGAIEELFDAGRPTATLPPSTRSVYLTLRSPSAGPGPHEPPASDPLAIDGARMFRRIRLRTQRLKFVLGYALPSEYYAGMSPVGAYLAHWRRLMDKALRLAAAARRGRRPTGAVASRRKRPLL
jgi:hypothetical protein